MGNADTVLQLKITLLEIEPPIWRQFYVTSSIHLARLHGVIQEVMGWTDSHLHRFRIGEIEYGYPDPDSDLLDDRKVELGKLIGSEGDRFTYIYDFGDRWEHELVIEKLEERDPEVAYPVCIAGARACPPEDCGGHDGFDRLLKELANPDDEEHEFIRIWVGEEYDPERWSPAEANRRLAPYRRRTAAARTTIAGGVPGIQRRGKRKRDL